MPNFRWRLLFLGAWAVALGAGIWSMFEYEMTPGAVADSIERWPSDSALHRDSTRPTLVMFIHPKCPCSRASLDELSVLAAHGKWQMSPTLVFIKPPGFGNDWEKTDLWRTAESIPGATLVCDRDGKEAARFGARISGETFLYDRNGRVLFHGGLTSSRGHRGDNAGRSAVELLLAGMPSLDRQTPVFGCSLSDKNCTRPDGLRPMNP